MQESSDFLPQGRFRPSGHIFSQRPDAGRVSPVGEPGGGIARLDSNMSNTPSEGWARSPSGIGRSLSGISSSGAYMLKSPSKLMSSLTSRAAKVRKLKALVSAVVEAVGKRESARVRGAKRPTRPFVAFVVPSPPLTPRSLSRRIPFAASLKELTEQFPWIEQMLVEILQNKLSLAKPVNEPLEKITPKMARTIGRGLSSSLRARKFTRAGVDSWRLLYPAIKEVRVCEERREA